jgi:hypothetical protein
VNKDAWTPISNTRVRLPPPPEEQGRNFHAVLLVSIPQCNVEKTDPTMTENEKYWLAGILEGEGSFMEGPPSDPNRPRISVQMSDKDIIERVADLFGVKYIHECEGSQENWSTTYQIEVRGKSAIELMRLLKPIMGNRRSRQIEDAIASHNKHYGTESRSDYSEERVRRAWELIQKGERLIDVSKKLNMKYQFVRDLNSGRTWTSITGL